MDATFWVAVSFVLFVAFLIYKKIPGLISSSLNEKINEIKNKINEAESLKLESDKLLSKYQSQLEQSKKECEEILSRAYKMSDEETSLMQDKIKAMLETREKNIEEKITQSKNNALKEITKTSTIIAIESAKKILSQTIEKNKIEDINYSSVKDGILSLKKNT